MPARAAQLATAQGYLAAVAIDAPASPDRELAAWLLAFAVARNERLWRAAAGVAKSAGPRRGPELMAGLMSLAAECERCRRFARLEAVACGWTTLDRLALAPVDHRAN